VESLADAAAAGAMKDTGSHQQIPGLVAPWKVAEARLGMEARRVTVRVGIDAGTKWTDPKTLQPAHLHKWTERRWRHMDTRQFETYIEARVPGVRCPDGRIGEVGVPWADRCQRVTRLLAQAVIVWLEACGNVGKVAGVMRLDWATVDGIMKAAVERGLQRRKAEPVEHAGLDGKSFRRGYPYAGIPTGPDKGRVRDLAGGRKAGDAESLLETPGGGQRAGVKAAAMDMRAAFEAAARPKMGGADIVHGKSHISACLNKAVDEVRKAEHREPAAEGRDTPKGTKYLWPRNFPGLRCEPSFRQLYAARLKTSRAWRLKEGSGGFRGYRCKGPAGKFFRDWHAKARRPRLEPMKKVAGMPANRLEGVPDHLEHRITNAASEGMDSLVAGVVANARGLRCFASFRIRVLFFPGKLDPPNRLNQIPPKSPKNQGFFLLLARIPHARMLGRVQRRCRL